MAIRNRIREFFDIRQAYAHLPRRFTQVMDFLGNSHTDKDLEKIGSKFDINKKDSNALINYFNFSVTKRAELYAELRRLQGNYIVDIVLSAYFDDFICANKTDRISETKYIGDSGEATNQKIQRIMDDFDKRLKLQKLIKSKSKLVGLHGDYSFKLIHDKSRQNGILAIIDDVDPAKILPVYRGMEKIGYLERKGRKLIPRDADSHVTFTLGYDTIQIKRSEEETYDDIIPEYLKCGKSLIFGAIDLIKQLDTLEKSNLALDVKRILAPVIISLIVPQNMSPERARKAANWYEGKLNSVYKHLGKHKNLTFKDLLRSSIRMNVFPQYGSGKGGISTLDIASDKESDREREREIKGNVALVTGVPPFYLLNIEGEEDKIRLLKREVKYSHRGVLYQTSFCEGISELHYWNLYYHGIEVEPENILTTMDMKVNIELLENQEHLIAGSASLQEFLGFSFEFVENIKQITQNTESEYTVDIDVKEMHEFVNRQLSQLGTGAEKMFVLRKVDEEGKTESVKIEPISDAFLPGTATHEPRITNFKQSYRRKLDWQKNRFRYQAGINRFHRINAFKGLKNSILARMSKKIRKQDLKNKKIGLNMTQQERFEFAVELDNFRSQALLVLINEKYSNDKSFVYLIETMNEKLQSIMPKVKNDYLDRNDYLFLSDILDETTFFKNHQMNNIV